VFPSVKLARLARRRCPEAQTLTADEALRDDPADSRRRATSAFRARPCLS